MKGLLYPYEHLLPACPIIMGKSVACEHLPLVRSLQKGTIMENMNVTLAATADAFTAEAENAAKTLNITAKTTLGEVLGMLGLTPGQKKPGKTPTPKALRISEEPVAKMYDCVIYRNGFAYYNNGSNHSVLWLPYCISFTYHFNPLRDSLRIYRIFGKFLFSSLSSSVVDLVLFALFCRIFKRLSFYIILSTVLARIISAARFIRVMTNTPDYRIFRASR